MTRRTAGAVATALLLVALAAGAADAADSGVREAVDAALRRGDRKAALAVLDAVADGGAAGDRERCVEAARAATDLVGGPDGEGRAVRILDATLSRDRTDRSGAWTTAIGLRKRALARELDFAAARALLTMLARVYPERLEYVTDLALLLRDGGLVTEARRAYERLVELAPSSNDARYRLAAMEEEAGDLPRALARFDDLIARGAEAPRPELRAHLQKGWLLRQKVGDLDAAARALAAGRAAARASEPSLERDEYLGRFDALDRSIAEERERRASLHAIDARLGSALTWAAALWAIVLGGGLVLLRRARWI